MQLNLLENLFYPQLGILNADFGILRVAVPAVYLKYNKQEKE